MGSSFVSVDRKHGFWTADSLHELWIFLLALQIDPEFEPNSMEARIRDDWMSAAKIGVGGCVWDHTDEFFADPEGRRIIWAATNELIRQIEASPEQISSDFLNLCGFSLPWFGPLPKRWFVAFSAAWCDLLNGKITTTASDAPMIHFANV